MSAALLDLRAKEATLKSEIAEIEARLTQHRRAKGSETSPNLPWILREVQGISPPPAAPALCDSATKGHSATFELNWDYSEGCSSRPEASSGERCLISKSPLVNTDSKKLLGDAILILGTVGLTVAIRKEEEGFESDSHYEMMSCGGYHASNEHGINVARIRTLGHDNPWLAVHCEDTLDRAREEGIVAAFTSRGMPMASLAYESVPLDVPGRSDLTLTATTGFGSTIFEMSTPDASGAGLIVGKALCSYENVEMGEAGPTLQLFETAKEWQGRGIGTALLNAVETFLRQTFSAWPVLPRFMATYVCNGHAARWFLRRGFRDDDGMGEELCKPLAPGALVPNMAGLLASSGSMAGLKEYLIALGQEDRGDESDEGDDYDEEDSDLEFDDSGMEGANADAMKLMMYMMLAQQGR